MFMKTCTLALLAILVLSTPCLADEPILVDHNCRNVTEIPSAWIDAAKANLHIAYGHTSHGSQVTSGMNGLITFTGGVGGPQFDWNNGGSGGALDLHDYAMGGDCGYYPQWVNNTTAYLDNPANADVNVIIWSWCGQVSGYSEQDMIDYYLDPMDQLEDAYPSVTFVYMTGHVNYWSWQNTCDRNQQIRDYCLANDKVLYDFADIESWDPDLVFYEYANDNCDYYQSVGGPMLGNWAQNWQNSHVLDEDWYNCSSAHSEPLNANLKAYAAWWLWARIAGWEGTDQPLTADSETLSAATGGSVNLDLNAGSTEAGRTYLILGSTSGSQPGYLLPGGLTTLPLNWDSFTDYALALLNTPRFTDFMGVLDGSGQASAQLNFPSLAAKHVGKVMTYAFLLEGLPDWDYASNAVAIEIVP